MGDCVRGNALSDIAIGAKARAGGGAVVIGSAGSRTLSSEAEEQGEKRKHERLRSPTATGFYTRL
jgi:hypothetical protein